MTTEKARGFCDGAVRKRKPSKIFVIRDDPDHPGLKGD